MDSKDKQVVLRRVRNGLIDYFELAASFEKQREYQRAVEWGPVPSEVINQYEDWVTCPSSLDVWGLPVFAEDEIAALRAFGLELDDVCARLPDPLPPLDEVQRHPAWGSLQQAANDALRVFLRRGKMDEADGNLHD